MEGGAGKPPGAPGWPQYAATAAPTPAATGKLPVLQQVNLQSPLNTKTHPLIFKQIQRDALSVLFITIIPSLGSAPCFHSLKMNPVSGLCFLGVWLLGGYFDATWNMIYWGLRAANTLPRQSAHERESPFSQHTRPCIAPARQRRDSAQANGDYMKDKLRLCSIKVVNQAVCASSSELYPPMEGSIHSIRIIISNEAIIKFELD